MRIHSNWSLFLKCISATKGHHPPPPIPVQTSQARWIGVWIQTICFFLMVWTLALIEPGVPFTSHCFDCCLFLGMWNNTTDLFIVPILSNIDIQCRRIIFRNFSLVLTCSFFNSLLRSLGTHLANFIDRLISLCSVTLKVLVDMPWTIMSFLTVTRL